jgi:hypothetical protein
MDTQVSVEDPQAFFLEAAAATYASGKPAVKTDLVPNFRVYTHRSERFVYVDTYHINGQHSFGQTMICAGDTPIWCMQYQGWSSNEPGVTNFLKRALLKAYTDGLFRAGRGPGEYYEDGSDDALVYENFVSGVPVHLDFEWFQGQERICHRDNQSKTLFYHRVQGMLLRDTPTQMFK